MRILIVARALFCWMALLPALTRQGGLAWSEDSIPHAQRLARIDKSITRGASYLVSQQQDDGTWRSKTYGLLKDGTSLTPLVLLSLPDSDATQTARAKGLGVLAKWLDLETAPPSIRVVPQYPVYTAGLVLSVIHRTPDSTRAESLSWRRFLATHQLTAANGWASTDARYGGWGYSHDPPQKPAEGVALSPLDEPNLSATVFALEGLTYGTAEDKSAEIRMNALSFVAKCQNWREIALAADAKFNDGGFHFVLDDEVRNKPGVAGTDSTGKTRFHSYGSATADGLRALLACGLKPDHPRVVAARKWLVNHVRDGAHPGAYPADRAYLQPALDYYYAASLAQAMRRSRTQEEDPESGHCAVVIAIRLASLQREDGSWVNPAVDVREDDPLIATSFALQSLQWCRDVIR